MVVSVHGPGPRDRGEDPSQVEAGTIWWTIDGHSWSEINGSRDFDPNGFIDLATALGETVVIVHRPYGGHSGSVWTGSAMG